MLSYCSVDVIVLKVYEIQNKVLVVSSSDLVSLLGKPMIIFNREEEA
jgi:hypothetical protein